jgi:hypothetical protein
MISWPSLEDTFMHLFDASRVDDNSVRLEFLLFSSFLLSLDIFIFL